MNKINKKLNNLEMNIIHILFLIIFITLMTVLILHFKKVELLSNIHIILLSAILFLVGLIDYKIAIIPNALIIIGLGLRLILYSLYLPDINILIINFKYDFLGALTGISLFLVLKLFSKDGIGYGDIKLYGVIGFYVGLSNIFSVIFFSIFASFIYAIYLMIKKQATREDTLPLGLFSFIGYLIFIVISM